MLRSEENPQISPIGLQETLQNARTQFQQLLQGISQRDWKHHLASSIRCHSLGFHRLGEISIERLRELYEKVFQKYRRIRQERRSWLQNQLKIFVWLVAASPSLFGVPCSRYGAKQLQKLTAPFFLINHSICEYQFNILFLPQSSQPWGELEDSLLAELSTKYRRGASWSTIAKQMFILSGKRYLRSTQACRERWQNHLDTRKARGKWTDQQDYITIKTIIQYGKRWSIINKKLESSRTQHMIKNRYKAILKREARKKTIRGAEQHQICLEIQKKLFLRISQQTDRSSCSQQKSVEESKSIRRLSKRKKKAKNQNVLKQIIKTKPIKAIQTKRKTGKNSPLHASSKRMEDKTQGDVSKFLSLDRDPVLPYCFQYPIFPQNMFELGENG